MDIDKLIDEIEETNLLLPVASKKLAAIEFDIKIIKFNVKQIKARLQCQFRKKSHLFANSPSEKVFIYDSVEYQNAKFAQLKKEQEKMELEGEINCLLQKIHSDENLLSFCYYQMGEEGGNFENDQADFWKQN